MTSIFSSSSQQEDKKKCMVLTELKIYETMQKNVISVSCEGGKKLFDMFTCSINIALPESVSPTFFCSS